MSLSRLALVFTFLTKKLEVEKAAKQTPETTVKKNMNKVSIKI